MLSHHKMIYTIAAIQQLTLRFSVDAVGTHSAGILVEAAQILQSVLSSNIEQFAKLSALFDCSGSPLTSSVSTMLCTWRPTHCIDVFLYFGPHNTVVVGLPMLADEYETVVDSDQGTAAAPGTTSEDQVGSASDFEIRHFSPESTTCAVEIPECVCFAHLTCDQDDKGNSTMVALVYDVLVKDQSTLDTRQRYEFIRSVSDPLSQVLIGNACVRVQWAGDPCMHDRLESLELPHTHHNIVFYGNKHEYHRYAFEETSSRSSSD